jgi:hypothetical protein
MENGWGIIRIKIGGVIVSLPARLRKDCYFVIVDKE